MKFSVKKKLTAFWHDVEADNAIDASLKVRRVVPDRQVVEMSDVKERKRK